MLVINDYLNADSLKNYNSLMILYPAKKLKVNDEGQSSAMDIKTTEVPSDKSFPLSLSASSPARPESPNTSYQDAPAEIPIKRKKFNARERKDISTALDLELISHLKKKTPTENDQNIGKSENELFCKSLIPILDRLTTKQVKWQKLGFNNYCSK